MASATTHGQSSSALLDRLWMDRPFFHQASDGEMTSWAAQRSALEFICENVSADMHTLETGAGYSTIAFAITGARHTCVTPECGEADRIREYLGRIGVESQLRFVIDSSDRALPRSGVVVPELDFVFIDGAHRFPLPCIDWHYCEPSVKVGGFVAVDDFRMPSVRLLHEFLSAEDEWSLVAVHGNTSFFRRIQRTEILHDWQGQKINRRPWPAPRSDRAIGHLHPDGSGRSWMKRKARGLWRWLAHGTRPSS